MWRGWRRLLFPALMRSVRRARRRSALLREMNSLETWERDALRRDLRLSEADLSGLARGNLDRPDLLPRLMRALSLGRVEAQVLRDLRRVCAQCQSADRCAEEVSRGSAAGSFGEFCPMPTPWRRSSRSCRRTARAGSRRPDSVRARADAA